MKCILIKFVKVDDPIIIVIFQKILVFIVK